MGDGRLAATARLNLARLLRSAGDVERGGALLEENERWYRSAGGGDFALLTRRVLRPSATTHAALQKVLDEARSTENLEVQLFALDALARLAAESGDLDTARALLTESDALAPQVAHAVDESDRYDAAAARALLG